MTAFLLADDSPEKLQMMQNIAKREWSGEILTAVTTEEAMRLIDQHDVSAAFIDYYIPTKLGPTIIKYLKKKNPNAHIALVTSSSGEHVAVDARHAGAEAVVCTSHQSDVVEKQLQILIRDWSEPASRPGRPC